MYGRALEHTHAYARTAFQRQFPWGTSPTLREGEKHATRDLLAR